MRIRVQFSFDIPKDKLDEQGLENLRKVLELIVQRNFKCTDSIVTVNWINKPQPLNP